MVAFDDRSFKGDEAATMALWNKIFNTANFTETPFQGSVHDYFCAQSYNQFRPVFDLVYVKVGNAKQYASTANDDENSQYLVQHVMEQLKQNPDIDWSRYDWNGDGYVNQLLIVYAGHGMNDSYGDLIWPHQWWMSEHLKDGQQGVYCDPIPVKVGSQRYWVDCYCAVSELTGHGDYGTFGTICHEYSHCFGFPDFYNGSTKYVGSWDLMDAGNYNNDGYQPAGYSAHERWLMGWLTPVELKENTTVVNMPALMDEGSAYLIRNDGYGNEYYFVENRQATGWDASLPGSGIVVFHIDYDPSVWTSVVECPNSYSLKRYTIFPANNQSLVARSNGWAYPYEGNDVLSNTSSPAATLIHANTDGKKLMNKTLSDIKVESGLASFRFTASSPSGIVAVGEEGSPQVLYRMGPVQIMRYPNGMIKKIITQNLKR